jgi:CheY-like chemotaxis protein
LEVQEGTQLERNLAEVVKAGDRAKDLVRQILAFCRKSETQRRPILFSAVVDEALKMLRSTLPTTIQIHQDILAESCKVLADSTQVQQVLMNLCTNAAHAMRDRGGVLKVSLVEVDAHGSKGPQDLNPGAYVRLTVSDTGHGMAPEVLQKIFHPYFTTKEKGVGTGMGLAVVDGIVKSHDGTITVLSEPGKGTTFHVYFPVVESELTTELERYRAIPTGNERILFVDDEEALVRMGQQMLEHLGYRVDARTSSVEALEAFRCEPNRFDLVITDHTTMPNMTGAELARQLMLTRSDIPIILCTGYSEAITQEKAKVIGIREFVMKPWVIGDLAERIRSALQQALA